MRRRAIGPTLFADLLALSLSGLGTGAPQAQTVLFGPQTYQRTAGPPNQFTDTFTLPAGTTLPYTLHVVNGNADGTKRISSATVKLNGTQILGPSYFGQNVAIIDRPVTLQASNTLEIRLTSAPGSFIRVSVLDTSSGTVPTALTPNPLSVTVGATANLTATLAPAPTAAGSVTVTSSHPDVATVPAAVSFTAGQTSVAIPVTAVAAGTASVTVSLNGASAASQVTVSPPPPSIASFTPLSGRVGDIVTITGTNFINVQTVIFNGVLAPTFTVTDATTLTALVPPTATTGPIAVTTVVGTGTSAASFTVIPAPTVASLQPATLSIVRGATGTLTVTLSAVQTSATTVTLASSNQAIATVPATVTVPAAQLSAPVTVTAVAVGQADITASLNGTSASSTISVVNPVPSLTTLSPASLPSGSPTTTLNMTGQSFVSGATVTFGPTALVTTFVSATQLTATIPPTQLTTKGTIPVTVTNPAPGGGASNSLSFTIVNGAPVLAPIGNQTVPLGSTLTFTATATDPDHDPVTFAMTPLPLPVHATFNTPTGLFTFTPDATQVGTVPLTVIASDGILTTSETITITVTGAPLGGVTGASGRVVDGSGQPIAAVPVSVKDTASATTTDAQGQFTLTNLAVSGRQVLLADGFALGYAILAAPVDLIPNVLNQLPSELRVPAIDTAHAVTVNPAVTTVISNPTLPNTTVTIAAGTAKNADGTNFTGALSISPVPEYGRPESRPVELKPGFSITIQPAGVVLDPPAPMTLPNTDHMPVGNEFDLWSLSPDTGTFLVVGRMRVSADGSKLEMIPGTGGVRKTAWHFALPPQLDATDPDNPNKDGDCAACQKIASGAELTTGALTHDEVVPGVRTLGVSRNLMLHYRSTNADVQRILPVNAALSVRAAVPATFSARLSIGGVQFGQERYWDSHALPENADSVSRVGIQFDGSSLQTGVYPYELMLFSNYPQSSIGGAARKQVLVRNEQASPFGAGWTLTAVDRLYPQADGSVVLAKGNGSTALYGAAGRPIVLDSFDQARSLTVNGVNASFVSGTMHAAARTDLLNAANFGALGTVRRSVTVRSGINVLTLQALTGVDIFVLNLLATELTATEVQALEQFVREGGAVLEMRNTGATRPLILGTLPGPFIDDLTADLTLDGANSIVANGAFGTVISPLLTGGNAGYATIGSSTVIANNDLGPNVLLLPSGTVFSGAGRAVLVGDEEIFASGYTGGAGANRYTEGSNRTFFLNTMAYLSGAPGYKPALPGAMVVTLQGPPNDDSTLVRNLDGTFTRSLKDGTTAQFTTQGLQTSVSDRNGNQTTYTYNGSGQLTTMTDPTGQVTIFAVTGGRVTTITDPANRVTQLEYDGAGNLQRLRSADASAVSFDYDSHHRLIRRTDARNQISDYTYDFAGRFAQATLPGGATRAVTPSQTVGVANLEAGQGTSANPAALSTTLTNRATFTDARANTTAFELDTLGRITKQTDALSRITTIARDPQGNPLVITRPNGAVTTMTYDPRGNLLTSTEQAIAATTTFTYEPTFNQVTSIKDPRNNTTTITYDPQGNPLTITDADNKVTTFTYDSRGLLLTSKDALNQTTTFTYDAQGRLLTTTDPLNRTTTLTYDPAGNVATSTDALTRVTSFQYDQKNRLKQVTDPLNGVTTYTYDGNGNLLTVKDAKNQVTTFAYDSRNRLTSTTDPLGKVETYTYDGNDNLLTRVTPKNDTIAFAYDAVNQLLSKTLPSNLVTSYTYDNVGNLLTVTDPDSALTMTYDQANRLVTTSTDGSPDQPAVTVASAYDQAGNRTSLTDPVQATNLSYDVLNRLTGLTQPSTPATLLPNVLATWPGDGSAADPVGGQTGTLQQGTTFGPAIRQQGFQFDGVDDYVNIPDSPVLDSLSTTATMDAWINPLVPLGAEAWLFARRDPFVSEGFSVALLQDGRIQLTVRTTTSPTVSGSTFRSTASVITFGQWHHVAAAVDTVAGTAQIWVNGQAISLTTVFGPATLSGTLFNVNQQYLGRRQDPNTAGGGGHFKGELDEVRLYGRTLTLAEVQSRAQNQPVATYGYDALSRRTSLTLPNGTQTTYTYDPASQVTQILHQLTATSTQINQAAYAYNPVGNRTSLTDRRGAQSFGYDALDRLTSASHPLLATPQAFAYDAVGNRTTGGSVVNAGNQLTADANFSYQDDDNGNLTRKTLLATGNYTQYTYDAENRLVKVEDFAAGNPTPAFTSTYRYDGLGRRIEKVANGQTKRYVYDGEDILLEYNGANVLQARYTHGPGIDEPLSRTPVSPGVGSGHTAVLASTPDGLRGPIVDDGIGVNGQVSVGFTLVSGQPTPAVGQPIDSTGSHQPIAPLDVTAATNSGTLTVNLIDTGGIGGNAALYLVTRDQATGQAIESRLLFPARVTFASTTPLGTPLVVASTTVPTTIPVADGTLYYHQDGLGTVTELTDNNGSVAKAYAYDAYGNLLESPGTVDQPYAYTGRESDSESGLYYYRARNYDSAIGRFLQKDPIGYKGGPNFYSYVRNSPLNNTDSTGLDPALGPYGVGLASKTFTPKSDKRPLGTILCNDGNPEVWIQDYYNDLQSQECGLSECLFKHEGVHLADALSREPLVCSGTKKKKRRETQGQVLGPQIIFGAELAKESEIRAYLTEELCLKEALNARKGNCPCGSLLNDRLNDVRLFLYP